MSDTTQTLDLDPSALAALGEGHVAYVRAMRSEEVKRLFPEAPDLTPASTCSPCCPPAARRSCSPTAATRPSPMPGRTTSRR